MDNDKAENALTRRRFIKTAGVAAASGIAGKVLLTNSGEAIAAELPKKWDMEADVIVLGFGGAGACAAIEAHDAGAKTLILEKQPEKTHYSNTRMSGGAFHCPDPAGDKSALKEYAKAMFSGENIPGKFEGEQPDVSDGLAEAWARYSPENVEFLKKLDPEFQPMSAGSKAAFPKFPGAEEAKYRIFLGLYKGKFNPYKPTKHLPKSEKSGGEAFFAALHHGVRERKIEILYETPAKSLIVNDDGEVIGVVAQNMKGQKRVCKAKRAVIITTGGFEFNGKMRRAFLEGPGFEGWAFYGSPANTGDGIEMALKIGAALDKVTSASARLIAALPVRYHGLRAGIPMPAVGKPHSVVVDSYGNRYAAEHLVTTDPSRYQFYKEAVKMDISELIYARIPSWLIFDETLMNKAPLTYMGFGTVAYDYVPWSRDNRDAVKKGWILKADTIEGLAKMIMDHPENRKMILTDTLSKTVERFNAGCQSKKDDFGRKASTMGPIDKPPYYAMPLYPGGPNTKGGIAANADREVLDWQGTPISRLYTAGEISSAFKFVYQGGGNLAECIVFGRIAGKNAAAQKPMA